MVELLFKLFLGGSDELDSVWGIEHSPEMWIWESVPVAGFRFHWARWNAVPAPPVSAALLYTAHPLKRPVQTEGESNPDTAAWQLLLQSMLHIVAFIGHEETSLKSPLESPPSELLFLRS